MTGLGPQGPVQVPRHPGLGQSGVEAPPLVGFAPLRNKGGGGGVQGKCYVHNKMGYETLPCHHLASVPLTFPQFSKSTPKVLWLSCVLHNTLEPWYSSRGVWSLPRPDQ